MDQLTQCPTASSHRELINFVPDRPGHDFRYAIDCTKISVELGWSPRHSFEAGLDATVKWYMGKSPMVGTAFDSARYWYPSRPGEEGRLTDALSLLGGTGQVGQEFRSLSPSNAEIVARNLICKMPRSRAAALITSPEPA